MAADKGFSAIRHRRSAAAELAGRRQGRVSW